MWRCDACFAYPVLPFQKPELGQYSEQYFERGMAETPAFTGYLSYNDTRALRREDMERLLRPWVGPGMRVLDVGCATGVAAEALNNLGVELPNVTGIDVSSYAIGVARSRVPHATFRVGDIETTEIEGEYDLVLLLDVLEHVSQPERLLTRIASHLSPGGRIVVTTPDPDCWQRRVFGSRWTEFHLGEHVVFVGKEWFRRVAATSGLSVARMWHDGKWVTFRHMLTRLQNYLPWVPQTMSTDSVYVNALDQLAVVLERSSV